MFFRRVFKPSGMAFLVIELSIGRPHIAVAQLTDGEAKIRVVEGNAQVFLIKPAGLLINGLAHHKAGRRDGRDVAHHLEMTEIA